MRTAIANLHEKYSGGDLPGSVSDTITELTSAVDDVSMVVHAYCESSVPAQAAGAARFADDLRRKVEMVNKLASTFHLALASDTGHQVNKVDQGVQKLLRISEKKDSRARAVEQRDSNLKKYRIKESKLRDHVDPQLRTKEFSGGSSTVRVKLLENEHTVAVKELRGAVGILEQKKQFHEFGKELAAMYEIRHQNCIVCYGYIESPLSFVMEYAERGELRQILSDLDTHSVLPLLTSLKLARGAAKGLAYLHNQGILHRDVKSLNIFVSKAFDAKLGDFGLSQLQHGAHATMATAATTTAFTPAWACPELEDVTYNTKCDVYSLGVVLWEIGTRLVPFEGFSVSKIIKIVCNKGERPDTAGSVPPEFTTEYDALVQKCWAKKPDLRPEMPEVVEALEDTWDALFSALFDEIDVNKDGLVTPSELTAKLTQLEYGFTEAQAADKFAQYDSAGTGYLEKPQLGHLFQNLYT